MMQRPRTKPAGVRRTELLDAAERLFIANGVHATSVDAIVSAADVAKGTFYLYFASKEAVIAALQERFVRSQVAAVATAVARVPADDWAARLDAWVTAFAADMLARIPLHDVVFHDAQTASAHHDNLLAEHLTALLADGGRAGAWPEDDPRLSGVMLFHAAHGAVHEAIAAPGGADRAALIAALTRFFRRAVLRG